MQKVMMAKVVLITSCVHLSIGLLLVILGFVDRFAHIKEYPRYYYDHSFRYIATPVWAGLLAMITSILGIIIGSRILSRYTMRMMVQLFKACCIVSGAVTYFMLSWSGYDLSSQAQWAEVAAKNYADSGISYYDKDDEKRLGVTAVIVTLSVLELFFCAFSVLFSKVDLAPAVGTYQVFDTSNGPGTSVYNVLPASEVRQMMNAPVQQATAATSAPNTVAYSVPSSGSAPQMIMVPVQQTVPMAGLQSPQA